MLALDNALGQTKEDCEALLVHVQKQDQVRGGVALAFQACDGRSRDAIADGVRAFLDIEIEATAKRLEDLKKLHGALDSISSAADSQAFIQAAQQPDLTHSQSAALSLLHDPDNRGALVGVAASSSSQQQQQQQQQQAAAPPSPRAEASGSSALDRQQGAVVFGSDRVRTDMERIVVALFAARTVNKWRILQPQSSSDEQQQPQPQLPTPPHSSPVSSLKHNGEDSDDAGGGSSSSPPALADIAHPLEMAGGGGAQSSAADVPVIPLITGNEKRRLATMLETEAGREALVHALIQQRSRRTEITEQGFTELAAAISIVLDKCRENRDIHTAKMAMMLSQTFWKNLDEAQSAPTSPRSPGSAPQSPLSPPPISQTTTTTNPPNTTTPTTNRDGREYVKSALESHPLWQDLAFWEDACWQSIRQSLKEGASDTAWHDMGPLETKDAVLRVHNIVFSQVGAYGHSMVEFGCSPHVASGFVRRLAATYQLAQDQLDMLLQLVTQ
jgi:hypothetical protein